MKCPFCTSSGTKVVDKRNNDVSIRRRRECLNSKKRFTTYEKYDVQGLAVIKKDGRKEGFNKEKIKVGILKAFEKRPLNLNVIDRIVNGIEAKIRGLGSNEIKSSLIGELVIDKLKEIDKIAYIRFASIYKGFKDITLMEQEIRKINKER